MSVPFNIFEIPLRFVHGGCWDGTGKTAQGKRHRENGKAYPRTCKDTAMSEDRLSSTRKRLHNLVFNDYALGFKQTLEEVGGSFQILDSVLNASASDPLLTLAAQCVNMKNSHVGNVSPITTIGTRCHHIGNSCLASRGPILHV
jgi:hypothetical protein